MLINLKSWPNYKFYLANRLVKIQLNFKLEASKQCKCVLCGNWEKLQCESQCVSSIDFRNFNRFQSCIVEILINI